MGSDTLPSCSSLWSAGHSVLNFLLKLFLFLIGEHMMPFEDQNVCIFIVYQMMAFKRKPRNIIVYIVNCVYSV